MSSGSSASSGPADAVAQALDFVGRGALRGQLGCARLQQQPHLEEVLETAVGEREHELQRPQQLLHAERGDERPRAVAALENVHDLQ
jgi:hypothetical protein